MLITKNKLDLVLISFLGLFLELALIRWLPAHIFSIAFFSNVVLIAAFCGLGLGFLLTHNKIDLFKYFPYFFAAICAVVLFLRKVQVDIPSQAQTWIWSYYSGNKIDQIAYFKIPILLLVGLVFLFTVAVFVPVGQRIGKLMGEFESLKAYSLNIFGSLLGVIVFGVLALFYTPAYVWFIIVGLIVFIVNDKDKKLFFGLIAVAVFIVSIWMIEKTIFWSPYYAINLMRGSDNSIAVFVNQLFHQKAINFNQEKPAFEKYLFPYQIFSPSSVLIIGAGTGNDVWVAEKAGVPKIDAVEIDPMIFRIGKTMHPGQPYQDSRVRVFIDDARSFMHKSRDKYDMIVFGTLDSHASLSVTSSIRLDNYVYTRQALLEAKQHLNPNGVVVLLFSVPAKWIEIRLLELARSVFGESSTRYTVRDKYLFNLMIIAGPGMENLARISPQISNIVSLLPPAVKMDLPEDNWPYLYLLNRGLPVLYLKVIAILILISTVLISIFSPLRGKNINPVFFLLGCGFLLLETKSVTTFSLLFGSTWIVNAVVFSAILTIALLANWLVMKRTPKKLNWFFAGLLVSLLFLYVFPVGAILDFSFWLKILISGTLIALPILFSSVIFAVLIQRTKEAGLALGSNLLGAVLGGFLEYTSMIWGLNALYLLAFCLYGLAAFSCRRDLAA